MRPLAVGLVLAAYTIVLVYLVRRLGELRRLEARIERLEAAAANTHASVRRIDFEDEGMDPRWTADQRVRVRKGRTLLFQAAQFARNIAESGSDPEKEETQQWLIGHVCRFVADAFGPAMARDIDAVVDRETQSAAAKTTATPAATLLALADFFEQKISALRLEDLDSIASAPESFKVGEIIRRKG